MIVVTTGGRHYDKYSVIWKALQRYDITLLAHGNYGDCDKLCDMYAMEHGIVRVPYDPDWGRYRGSAGPIRNGLMLREIQPHRLIAFPGHRGTHDCIRQAEEMGIRVVRFGWLLQDAA